MARKSQAQQTETANEEQALAFFEQALAALPDPRRRQGLRYPLRTVVVTALMAMVSRAKPAMDGRRPSRGRTAPTEE